MQWDSFVTDLFQAEPLGPWEIVRFSSSPDDILIDFLDRPAIIEFLRQYKSDYMVMACLREVLWDSSSVSRLTDDELIEMIAWELAERRLAFRRLLRRRIPTTAGGGGKAKQKDSSKASSSDTGPARQSSAPASPAPKKKSWFAITVVQEIGGKEKAVDGLTLACDLPDLGHTTGVTSRSPIRWDDLNPGGTGDVLATSHDEIVWEVVSDID